MFQEGEGGIAAALALAEDFADGESVAVVLGDNTTDADISKAVSEFDGGAMIFLKRVVDPRRYGVPVFSNQRIVRIEEKPGKPKSNYAVAGLYLYDNHVFEIIKKLKPSARGELEITDVNNAYLKMGKLEWQELKGFWTDAGKFETLFTANAYWAKKNGAKV